MTLGFNDLLAWRWRVPREKKDSSKSVVVEAATAITAYLKTVFPDHEVERAYASVLEDYEIRDIKIVVVPRSWERESVARGIAEHTVEIDIAVIKPIECETPEKIDPIMSIIQLISDRLNGKKLSIFDGATCAKIKNDPIFASRMIDENRKFASLITATVKVLERKNAVN